MTPALRCEYCKLEGHSGASCNRPEGVAARGGRVLHLGDADNPVGFNHASREKVTRGAARGGRTSAARRRAAAVVTTLAGDAS